MTHLRKAAILEAIQIGSLTYDDALSRYAITPEELLAWSEAKARHGHRGLRLTRLQAYQPERRRPRRT
jgi:hypothetical protein